jgi:hypothetical protein
VVRNLGDVSSIRVNFSANEFEAIFYSNYEDTSVSVHSVVSTVFLITRYLNNFERDKTVGRNLTKLF